MPMLTLAAGLAQMERVQEGDAIKLTGDLVTGSSGWWLKLLLERLDARAPELQRYEDYFAGKHPLTFASKRFRRAFGSLFADFSDNFCPLVVEAVEERLDVEGFRMGNADAPPPFRGVLPMLFGALLRRPATEGQPDTGAADQDAWRIWQMNRLDAESQLAHTELLVNGITYVMVSPWRGDWLDAQTPAITIESPTEMIVDTVPGSPHKRRAALKRWVDDEGYVCLNLYLPDRLEKYQSEKPVRKGEVVSGVQWVTRETLVYADDGTFQGYEEWPLPNPLGVVPVIPLANRVRLADREGKSEIHDIIHIQDAINKVASDMLLASEFGAFPQKYALNLHLETDAEGNPKEPFDIAVDKMIVVEPAAEGEAAVEFGQFAAADLEPFRKIIEMLVQHASSITRTPAHYLLGSQGSFPSGESLRATEAGLVMKARRKMRQIGEGWEEAMQLAFKALEDPRGDIVDGETIWRDPETRTEAEHTDAQIKQLTAGVPYQQIWINLGYTPQERGRFPAMWKEALEWGLKAPTPRSADASPNPAGGAPMDGAQPPPPAVAGQ